MVIPTSSQLPVALKFMAVAMVPGPAIMGSASGDTATLKSAL